MEKIILCGQMKICTEFCRDTLGWQWLWLYNFWYGNKTHAWIEKIFL